MLFRRASWLFPFLLVAGCNTAPKSSDPTAAKPPVPVANGFAAPKDDLGRVIDLKAPAKRVIVIGPGAIETVCALGAQKNLVGRDDFADFPAEAKKVAVAGDYQGPGVEKSIALRPDLVIVQGETWDKARVEQWQNQIGAPVAALTPTSVEGVAKDIEKISKWLGKGNESDPITGPFRTNGVVRVKPKLSAFFEIGRSPLYSAGSGTLIADVMQMAGFRNVAADIKGYQPFGIESLIARAPDVYIVTSKLPRAEVLRDLRSNAALSKLGCVQRGQIIVVDGDWVLRPGPRLRLGIAALQRARNAKNDLVVLKTRS